MASSKGTKGWFETIAHAVGELVVEAEMTQKCMRGADKKRWVKDELKGLLKHIDIPYVPEWLEPRIEAAVVDCLIDFTCALLNDKEAIEAFDRK